MLNYLANPKFNYLAFSSGSIVPPQNALNPESAGLTRVPSGRLGEWRRLPSFQHATVHRSSITASRSCPHRRATFGREIISQL